MLSYYRHLGIACSCIMHITKRGIKKCIVRIDKKASYRTEEKCPQQFTSTVGFREEVAAEEVQHVFR